jgi:hypothetical protein
VMFGKGGEGQRVPLCEHEAHDDGGLFRRCRGPRDQVTCRMALPAVAGRKWCDLSECDRAFVLNDDLPVAYCGKGRRAGLTGPYQSPDQEVVCGMQVPEAAS